MPQNKQRSQYNIVIIKTFGRQIAVFGQAAQNLDHLFHPEHKLRRAINYINDNLTEDVSLEAIADAVGISMYYFVQLFKQSTGFTPYQYVLQCRVERA
ncbi:MAG: AraC family transcriptional regulator [Rhizonema sp. NSF051]|nr:AraC family transcriptional regulator [Rhizonema sp. NSF051]